MKYKTHLVFAVLIGVVLSKLFDFNGLWFWILICIGGLFADIDIPKSWIGRKSGFVSEFVSFVFGHRGFIHSIWFGLFVSVGLWFVFGIGSVGFLIGFLSHLFLDGFTKQGVYVFYPFNWKMKGNVRSGGFVDWVLFWIFLGVVVLTLVF